MREAPAWMAAALFIAAGIFTLLSAIPATSTWGSATYVEGTRTVMSAQDAVGVISLRLLLTLAGTGLLMLVAARVWRD